MVEYRGYCKPLDGKVDFQVESVNSLDTSRGVKWQVKGFHDDYTISVFTSEGKAKELLTLMAEKNIHEAEDIVITYDMEELIPYPLSSEEKIKGTVYEMEELIPYPLAGEEEEEEEWEEEVGSISQTNLFTTQLIVGLLGEWRQMDGFPMFITLESMKTNREAYVEWENWSVSDSAEFDVDARDECNWLGLKNIRLTRQDDKINLIFSPTPPQELGLNCRQAFHELTEALSMVSMKNINKIIIPLEEDYVLGSTGNIGLEPSLLIPLTYFEEWNILTAQNGYIMDNLYYELETKGGRDRIKSFLENLSTLSNEIIFGQEGHTYTIGSFNVEEEEEYFAINIDYISSDTPQTIQDLISKLEELDNNPNLANHASVGVTFNGGGGEDEILLSVDNFYDEGIEDLLNENVFVPPVSIDGVIHWGYYWDGARGHDDDEDDYDDDDDYSEFNYYDDIDEDDLIPYDGRYDGKTKAQLLEIEEDRDKDVDGAWPKPTLLFCVLYSDVEDGDNFWDLEAYLNQFTVRDLTNKFIRKLPYVDVGNLKSEKIEGIVRGMADGGGEENIDGDALIEWIEEYDMGDMEITVYPDDGDVGHIYLDEDEDLALNNAEEVLSAEDGLDPKYLKKDGRPDMRYKASREWVKSQESTEIVEVSVAPHVGLNLEGSRHLAGMVDVWESEGIPVENQFSLEEETKELIPFIGATRVIPKAVYYQMALHLPQSVSVTPTQKGESIILGFHEQDYSRVEGLINAYGIPTGGPPKEKGIRMFQAEEESTLPLPDGWAEDLSNFNAENIPLEAEEFYGGETEVMSLDEYYSNVMDFKDSDTVNVDFAGNVIVKSNEGGIYDGEEFEAPLEPDHLCITCGNLLQEFTHNCINPAHTHPIYGCVICDDVCSFCDKQTQIESFHGEVKTFNSPSREDWLYYCQSCGAQNSKPTSCHACGSDEVKIVVMASEEESKKTENKDCWLCSTYGDGEGVDNFEQMLKEEHEAHDISAKLGSIIDDKGWKGLVAEIGWYDNNGQIHYYDYMNDWGSKSSRVHELGSFLLDVSQEYVVDKYRDGGKKAFAHYPQGMIDIGDNKNTIIVKIPNAFDANKSNTLTLTKFRDTESFASDRKTKRKKCKRPYCTKPIIVDFNGYCSQICESKEKPDWMAAESFKEWSEEELKEKDHPDKDVTFDNWLDKEIEEHGDVKLSVWKDREHEEKEHQAEDDWEDFEEGTYEDDWEPDFPEFEDKPKLSTVATIVGIGALAAYLAPNEIKNMLKKLR